MFNQLLPPRIDHAYRGSKLAPWLLALLVLMKVTMGVNCIFNGYSVASSADGIPLATFPPGAAQTIVSSFALWGLSQIMYCLLGVLALVRYHSMVPFIFAFFLLEHLSRKLILQFHPMVRTGSPPGTYVNLGLLALMIVGLGLSLLSRGNAQVQD